MAHEIQLVDLMHGEINLSSELGRGTTTTFWIPFHKPQSRKRGSPLVDANTAPNGYWSDETKSRCLSAPQSLAGDPHQNLAPPSRTGTGSEPMSSEEGSNEEIDRKNIHVLIVEDKYVTIFSCKWSFASMSHIAE